MFAAAYTCVACEFRVRRTYSPFGGLFTFLLSRSSRCIRCNGTRVHRQPKRDRIDAMSRHPLSALLWLTGAPRNRCIGCRLQYYDWRRPAPNGTEQASVARKTA